MLKALEKTFGYVFTAALIGLAAQYHSAAFAYASVISLLVTLGRETFSQILEVRVIKNTMPEEGKKKMTELETRVTNIELGIQRRGF